MELISGLGGLSERRRCLLMGSLTLPFLSTANAGVPPEGLKAIELEKRALDARRTIPEIDIKRILDSGRLTVAMGKFESPPFFKTVDGTSIGQDVEFAHKLASALGVRLVLKRETNTFNAVVDAVERNEADIAISKISITYPRALRVRFSDPYLVLRHGMAFNRVALAKYLGNRDLASQLRQWDGEIGVIEKSSFVGFAEQRFPKAKVREMPSWGALVDAVLSGKMLCAYRDELEIKQISRAYPSASLHIRTAALTDTRDSIGMVMNRDSSLLQAFVNIFLQNQQLKLTADSLLESYKDILK